ncbi:hypothetical protein BH10PAT2_BH10PAT2_4200 [soil metagenome]
MTTDPAMGLFLKMVEELFFVLLVAAFTTFGSILLRRLIGVVVVASMVATLAAFGLLNFIMKDVPAALMSLLIAFVISVVSSAFLLLPKTIQIGRRDQVWGSKDYSPPPVIVGRIAGVQRVTKVDLDEDIEDLT